MRVLDLFSGIGGFSLGLERAGMKTVAFCEIDPYCRRVLAKHWPEVPIYDDVRTLTAERLAADGIGVDLICGGFPCQDISCAGKGAGLAGERSGLWSEYARLIGELRPRFVVVENVAALLGRGLDTVLGDLAALGFDAEWHCIPASAVGAPHRRDRVWVVAYPDSKPIRGQGCACAPRATGNVPKGEEERQRVRIDAATGRGSSDVADADGAGLPNRGQARGSEGTAAANQTGAFAEFERCCCTWWLTEPDVGRVAHGIPARVDRLKGLGNAVVPQIPELIGRAILATEAT